MAIKKHYSDVHIAYREDLKSFMRDSPEFNELSNKDDFTDEELDRALIYGGVRRWNSTKPIIGRVSVESHPEPDLLIFGAAIYLCDSDSIREARNPLAFGDGGISTNRAGKPGQYRQALADLRAEYRDAVRGVKGQSNISKGWGRISSEYGPGYGYGYGY